VLVAGLSDECGHRARAACSDHVVDGEGAAGDVSLIHHLHGFASGLVVPATRSVRDDHPEVAAVVASSHAATGRCEYDRDERDHDANHPVRPHPVMLPVTRVDVEMHAAHDPYAE
jgi:hypothetical protein